MPSKLQTYMQMADEAQRQITGSYRGWTGFLTTATRLYKYPYAEQVMIHAQRPDATACAEYDFWNQRMGRYVRRGSKGIALIDSSGERPRLRYVFDVSDTGGREFPKSRYLWEYREEHADAVSAMLESRYGVDGKGGLPDQLERIASQLAEEYWRDYKRDILAIVDDSFLYGYDEFNVGAAFQSAAAVSIAYSLMSRCGLEADDRFEHEDFLSIFDFNTPEAAAELGTAVSRINGEVLRQIEVTIKNYEREKLAERSHSHDRADLHQERGLPDSRPDAERNAGGRETPGQVRETAQELPSGAQTGAVQPSGAVGEAVPAPAGDRRDGEPEAGADDAGADEVGGRDGGAESPRSDEMGGADEHLQGAGRGDHSQRAGVQLTNDAPEAKPAQSPIPQAYQLSLFPTEEEQIAYIAEAESYTPSAFSMSIPQADIDHILRMEGNADYARMKIATEFSKGKSAEEIAAFLQSSFHGGNGVVTENGRYSAWYAEDGIHIANGDAARYLTSAKVVSWQEAAERIGRLLERGEYAANVELAEAPGHERAELAQSIWYLRQDLSEKARAQGYLSCLSDMRGGGFPEETARLAERLRDPAFREVLMNDFAQLRSDYREDRSLLRFRYHKPDKIEQGLLDLSLPRREYRTEMAEIPAVQRFITEDEIAATLTRGSNIAGGKGRIYAYFKEKHTSREQADFLKDEYGIGGRSHAVSGASHSGEDHSGKGVSLKKQDCPEIQLNWANVAKRISELIRKDRFLTPEEKARFEQLQQEKEAERELPTQAQTDYNAIKEAHPDDIVLYQVGDFFELYGEDAKQAAELLDMNLTSRNIPGAGRVEMCGVPSHNLEMYVEKLRDKYDVTIAEAPDFRGERHIYTLRSIDHEAEAAIDAQEAEFGADGTRVFRDPATEQVQPTVQEHLEHYRPVVMAAVSEDTAYRNACGHSDRENAEIECNAAVRRAVLNSKDMELIRLFSDMPEFRSRLHREVFEGTYARLHDLLRPLSQDDIDDALRAWNGNIGSKHAVVRYMEQHGREKETAAWLAREYGGNESKSLFIVRAGSPETVELTWPKVQRRIAQLIQSDNFNTERERDNFDDIDPVAVREALAQRGIVGGEVADPEKLNNDPFIQRVMQDTEQISAQEQPTLDPADRFHVVSLDRGFRTLYAVWDDETHGYYVDADGVTEEFTSEWQAEAYRLELQGQAEQALLERAKGLISDFCRSEYGSEADFSDPAKIGVAYTTVTDDEIPIQVNIDLVNYRLERYLDDEQQYVFPNTHEPIISQELWDSVQKRRSRVNRASAWGTHSNRLSGYLYCADCGRRMTLQTHYSKKDGSVQYSYRCGGYASRVNSCTSHTISADNVEALILSAVKRFSKFVLNDEKAFALELQSLWNEKQEEKPKYNQSELQRCQKRYDELSALVRGLYENLISGLLPERQYKQLMKQYDDEQAELETKMEMMKSELAEEKVSSVDIKHFISLIRKCKNPTKISDTMFNELVDKIVVYEAEGVGKARTQKVDIYFNYVGQVDIAYTEEELAEIETQKEQEEQQRLARQRKREKAYREKRKAQKIAENGGETVKTKVCPHCNKEFIPTSNRQVFCSKECCYQSRQEEKKADREAERGNHYYRQRECAVCGNSYWPTHSQQKYCSEECQKESHNKKSLEFYHHKREKEKLQCKDLSQTRERVSDMNLSGTITTPA